MSGHQRGEDSNKHRVKKKAPKPEFEQSSIGKIHLFFKRLGEIGTGVVVLVAVIGWLFHKRWAFILTLFIVPVAVFFLCYFWRLSKRWSALCVVVAVAVSVCSFFFRRSSFHVPPAFSVSMYRSGGAPPTPNVWYVEDNDGVARGIYFTAWIDFQNLRTSPMEIMSCCLQLQKTNGDWEDLWWVPTILHGSFYMGWDTKDVTKCEFGTFQSAIEGKNIAPLEHVQGWIFFTKPIGTYGIRLWAEDADGSQDSEPINEGFMERGIGNQPVSLHITTNHVDISQLRQIR
jgi:hypothetical protein